MGLFIIAYMGIMSGWSGGSLLGHKMFGRLDFMPEILFALGFVFAWYSFVGWWALFVGVWSYGWMQAATANGLHWGRGEYKPHRDTSFSPIVNKIADIFSIDRSSAWYCRVYMGVKGFLITLPVGGLGFILWPLGYEMGDKVKNHTVSEVTAGAGAGLSIVIALLIMH